MNTARNIKDTLKFIVYFLKGNYIPSIRFAGQRLYSFTTVDTDDDTRYRQNGLNQVARRLRVDFEDTFSGIYEYMQELYATRALPIPISIMEIDSQIYQAKASTNLLSYLIVVPSHAVAQAA